MLKKCISLRLTTQSPHYVTAPSIVTTQTLFTSLDIPGRCWCVGGHDLRDPGGHSGGDHQDPHHPVSCKIVGYTSACFLTMDMQVDPSISTFRPLDQVTGSRIKYTGNGFIPCRGSDRLSFRFRNNHFIADMYLAPLRGQWG